MPVDVFFGLDMCEHVFEHPYFWIPDIDFTILLVMGCDIDSPLWFLIEL